MPARLIIRRQGVPDRIVSLNEGPLYTVGRAAEAEVCVPDEPQLGKRHATVRLSGVVLRVARLAPEGLLLRDGESLQSFELAAGGSFAVGYTRFVFEAA
ncbi:MAG: FHA domain-containing protein [Elusimicrobia bacterium]|nr:FHA domain-containing protein [Elusimicrobiota bacterium]